MNEERDKLGSRAVESGVKVLGGGRSASVPSVQVFDNFGNHLGIGDEGKDAKTSAAIAKERVGLENPLSRARPEIQVQF